MNDSDLDGALRHQVDAGWTPDLTARVLASVRSIQSAERDAPRSLWARLLAPGAVAVAAAAIVLAVWTLALYEGLARPDVRRPYIAAGDTVQSPRFPEEAIVISAPTRTRHPSAALASTRAVDREWGHTLPPLEPPEPLQVERLADTPLASDRLSIEPLRLEALAVEALDD